MVFSLADVEFIEQEVQSDPFPSSLVLAMFKGNPNKQECALVRGQLRFKRRLIVSA
ncbi:hypothetical protein Scep_002126 [Stephania cephalantha]|uniref:Uncharacterized protein n=1 Tax=Stephania cephalantha TaxID=152367 RepID=A0AAP0LC31_9MAGN